MLHLHWMMHRRCYLLHYSSSTVEGYIMDVRINVLDINGGTSMNTAGWCKDLYFGFQERLIPYEYTYLTSHLLTSFVQAEKSKTRRVGHNVLVNM